MAKRLAVATLVAVAALAALPAAAGAAATYNKTFGFNGPAGLYAYGMDFDPTDNTVLVGDYWNYRVKRFSRTGSFLRIVSKTRPGGSLGGITAPYDVEADLSDRNANGNAAYWVADQGSSRIVQFTHKGKWLQTVGLGGGGTDRKHPGHKYPVGCGGGKMTIPTHLWVSPSTGRLYVSDPRCRAVYIFGHGGGFIGTFKWSGSGAGTPIPRGITGDGNGNVFVVEHNTRSVFVFSGKGQFRRKFPRVDDMNDPRGLDMDPGSKRVYVVSAYKNKVYQFNSQTGALIRSWGTSGGAAGGGTKFDSVRFPAVDRDGNVYVGDTWGYRVWKFDQNGQPMGWREGADPPPNGGYNRNNGIGVSPAGHLFVVDTFEQRVQKFDTSSSCPRKDSCPAWMMKFGSREPAGLNSKGFGYPRELIFADGNVWIGDNNNAVLVWTAGGTFVHRFGSQGSAPGQFKGGVQGLAVTGGKVYTTDIANCRLQIFSQARLMAARSIEDDPGALLQRFGSCGSGNRQMIGPRGIVVHGNEVMVGEAGGRISVWNTRTGDHSTYKPTCGSKRLGPTFDLEWNNPQTWIYAADAGNDRVVRFKPNRSACEVVTGGGSVPGDKWDGPHYLAFGPDGKLYVSDNSRHVYAFTGA
jgi:tripartite motif-containing protein 71